MRILVTGAGGFVGPYLIRQLSKRKDKIFGMLAPSESAPEGIPEGVVFLKGDVVDRVGLRGVVERAKPDMVYHLAGWSHIGKAIDQAPAVYSVNLMGTVNLYEALREVSPRAKVLFVGTGASYGPVGPGEEPPTEEQPLQPQEPYAGSKAAADMASVQYFRAFALPVVRVRPFNIIGPGQKPTFAYSEWARQLVRMKLGLEEPVLQVGKLDVERDFTDVRDMVVAFEQVLGHGLPGEVFNLGSGHAVALGEVLRMLREIVGVEVKVVQDATKLRKVEPGRVTGSIAKARARLGWAPKITLAESLKDIVAYWHEQESKGSRG